MAETASNREPNQPEQAPAANSRRSLQRSESQWALVWREFRRRRLAVLSGCVILVLVTVSIFAPFLANDRPLCYRGYNRFEYREALRTLSAVIAKSIKWQTSPADDSPSTGGRKQAEIIEQLGTEHMRQEHYMLPPPPTLIRTERAMPHKVALTVEKEQIKLYPVATEA